MILGTCQGQVAANQEGPAASMQIGQASQPAGDTLMECSVTVK